MKPHDSQYIDLSIKSSQLVMGFLYFTHNQSAAKFYFPLGKHMVQILVKMLLFGLISFFQQLIS